MTTITRFTTEQLIARADHLLCVGKAFIAEHPEYDGMAKDVELFKIALASLTAESIGITDRSEIECLKRGEMANVMPPDYKGVDAGDEVYVYAAPPAPVVHQEPIAWLNDAYLARGVVDGEAGSQDAGPGYIPVYREPKK
ncbi:hypothetical protein [Citrobacter amalonaticus]|uniref:Uncharacterized protein n=1 Tax=uncultured Citrobacter sp. TaxID=200446 RepID=A0A212I3T2_9ENTR|nr:hypothetical protein [Citrobacter amalonaticus]SAZ33871.1 protein of unknown function [Citrobacter amalonaticus]SBV61258.1 hypothetical protein KM92CIT3_120048 [uncultured Citrobacter sp.]